MCVCVNLSCTRIPRKGTQSLQPWYVHMMYTFHLDLALQQRICWDMLPKGFLVFLHLQASHLALKFPLKIFSEMQQRSHASPSWRDHQTTHTHSRFKCQILQGFGQVKYLTCPPDVSIDQRLLFPYEPVISFSLGVLTNRFLEKKWMRESENSPRNQSKHFKMQSHVVMKENHIL